jgi:hypothetical protein
VTSCTTPLQANGPARRGRGGKEEKCSGMHPPNAPRPVPPPVLGTGRAVRAGAAAVTRTNVAHIAEAYIGALSQLNGQAPKAVYNMLSMLAVRSTLPLRSLIPLHRLPLSAYHLATPRFGAFLASLSSLCFFLCARGEPPPLRCPCDCGWMQRERPCLHPLCLSFK